MTDDEEKPPFRAPGWIVPYGVALSLILAAVGFACLSPLGPAIAAGLGSASVTLTGWFLILGAALTAYSANSAEPGGILDSLGQALFGSLPLYGFFVVCCVIAFQGSTASPVVWHAAAFALPALAAGAMLSQLGEPEDSDYEIAERVRLTRGDPDPLSVDTDPRLEPAGLQGSGSGIMGLIVSLVSTLATIAAFFTYVCLFLNVYFGLYAEVFERAVITPENFAAKLAADAPEFFDRFAPLIGLAVFAMIVGTVFDFFQMRGRARR
jgi:hypothetical protein